MPTYIWKPDFREHHVRLVLTKILNRLTSGGSLSLRRSGPEYVIALSLSVLLPSSLTEVYRAVPVRLRLKHAAGENPGLTI